MAHFICNIVIIVNGFQHGKGPYHPRKITISCPELGSKTTQNFKIPPPSSWEEAKTYGCQTACHGLNPGDDGAEPSYLTAMVGTFLMDARIRSKKPVRVWSKGSNVMEFLYQQLGEPLSNLEDRGTFVHKGLTHEEKVHHWEQHFSS